MSNDVSFGTFPKVRPMKLTTGQDFNLTLRSKTAYPSGAALKIVFSTGVEWAATVSGTDAVWSVNKTTVDQIAGNGVSYQMTYADSSGADLVPYEGPVYRNATVR